MSNPPLVTNPAPYVTPVAIGTTDADGKLSLVRSGAPLPVTFAVAEGAAPISGTMAASGQTPGFIPVNSNPVTVELAGSWSGTVRLVRSTDGGTTVAPLKVAGTEWAVYSANGIEQAWSEAEKGVSFHLAVSLVSGALNYRVSQ